MTTRTDEQRRGPRGAQVLRVAYPDRVAAWDATENLSADGLFVQTDLPFQVGERVRMTLSFPGLLDPVEVAGRVAWIRPPSDAATGGVGIRAESDADRQRLEDILNSPPATPQAPQGYRVLIVEDNPHIVEMYSYVLKKLASGELAGKVPLDVQFAPDGHRALQMLREGQFSLVMTDLYMPVMDGFQLVERIRQDEALQGIPVIAISAGGKEAQDRCMALGVDVYLRKPVRFVEVLETVKQLLRIR